MRLPLVFSALGALVVGCYLQTCFAVTYLESLAKGRRNVEQPAVLQPRLADLTGCVTVGINLPLPLLGTVTIVDNLCLCLNAGILTGDSAANLGVQLSNENNSNLQTLLGLGSYTVDSLTSLLVGLAVQALGTGTPGGNQAAACNYPTGAIPYGCGTCNYNCPQYQSVCGNACVSNTTVCISGVPQRRRWLEAQSPLPVLCPKGLSACAIPGSGLFNGDNYECVNTKVDIESCGGCAFPLPGRKQGEDCSAIPHISSVSCLSGACLVNSCVDGYTLKNNACVAVNDGGSFNPLEALLDFAIRDPAEPEAKVGTARFGGAKKSSDRLAKYQVKTIRLREQANEKKNQQRTKQFRGKWN